MKKVGDVWLPDDETDAVMLRAGALYQSPKLLAALPFCRKMRTAIDIGAHCGLWTLQLAQHFQRVEAFEPLQRHIECWKKNAGGTPSSRLHELALGEKDGTCRIQLVEGSSGRSHVAGAGELPMKRLDDYAFEDVDFMKIDVEGYEYFALKGAEQTLLRWRPCIVVEQKPGLGARYGLSERAAVEYLQALGAVLRGEIVGDYVMSWAG